MTPGSALQRGISMIEVLVTMVIIAFGLLGIAGLQARLQSSEMESYQRSQALMLLDDMVNRMNANRETAVKYPENAPLASPVGAGMTCTTTDGSSTRVQKDIAEWCNALQGAAELANGKEAGAMVGGRGCVEDMGLGDNNEQRYRVSVAWQGLTPVAAPAEAEACGKDLYNGATGSVCHDDLCRRVVSTVVFMANLR